MLTLRFCSISNVIRGIQEVHDGETRGREERTSYLRVALGYWYLKGGFPMTTEAG